MIELIIELVFDIAEIFIDLWIDKATAKHKPKWKRLSKQK